MAVSGVVVGGVVGYVSNVSRTVPTTLNIINHLNRGNISATGEDYDSYYNNDSLKPEKEKRKGMR